MNHVEKRLITKVKRNLFYFGSLLIVHVRTYVTTTQKHKRTFTQFLHLFKRKTNMCEIPHDWMQRLSAEKRSHSFSFGNWGVGSALLNTRRHLLSLTPPLHFVPSWETRRQVNSGQIHLLGDVQIASGMGRHWGWTSKELWCTSSGTAVLHRGLR